jgi:Retrotransposon gag protein/Aspartyl protease
MSSDSSSSSPVITADPAPSQAPPRMTRRAQQSVAPGPITAEEIAGMFQAALQAQAATAAAAASTESHSSTTRVRPDVIKGLPKFRDPDFVEPRDFVEAIALRLDAYEVPQRMWVNYLVLMVPKPAEGEWVRTQLLNHQPPYSWDEISRLFQERFADVDFDRKIDFDYERIRQKNSETASEYVERFRYLMSKRKNRDDDDGVIKHFLHGLDRELRAEMDRHFCMQANVLRMTHPHLLDDRGELKIVSWEMVSKLSIEISRQIRERSGFSGHGSRTQPPSNNRGAAEQRSKSPAAQRPAGSFVDRRPQFARPAGGKVRVSVESGLCFKCQKPGHKAFACTSTTGTAAVAPAPQVKLEDGAPRLGTRPAEGATPQEQKRTKFDGGFNNRPASNFGVRAAAVNDDDTQSEGDDSDVVGARRVEVCDQRVNPPLDLAWPDAVLSDARAHLMLTVQGRTFLTKIDSGADRSLIDQQLAAELQLAVRPITGVVQLAAEHAKVPRVGAVEMTAVFTFLGTMRSPESVNSEYEVFPLGKRCRFLIGMDLIRVLWPDNVPTMFMTPAPQRLPPATPVTEVAAVVVGEDDDSSFAVQVVDVQSTQQLLEEMRQVAHADHVGELPEAEVSSRVVVSTPMDDAVLAATYERGRQ